MGEFTIDHVRAAQREAEGTTAPVVAVFNGKRFNLPDRAPIGFLENLGRYAELLREAAAGDSEAKDASLVPLFDAARDLLGSDGAWKRFKRAGADLDATMELIHGALRQYGLGGVGEARASGSSSSPTGESSRPTSPGSIESGSPASSQAS